MLPKLLTSLALAGLATAQSLSDVIAANSDLSQLATLIKSIPGVIEQLTGVTNVTLLAPSNAAIGAFISDPANVAAAAADPGAIAAILSYHVLMGVYRSTDITATAAFVPTLLTNTTYTNVTGGQRVKVESSGGAVVVTSGLVRQSRVVTADITFDGGLIHVVDQLLTIPQKDSTTAAAAGLNQLTGALATANLVSTIDELTDVTIFAPSDSGFAAIQSQITSLSVAQLTTVLQYHVVQGTVGYSTSLTDGQTLMTLAGQTVNVTIADGMVHINGAMVTMADVLVSNGVVQVIDSVLSPGGANTSTSTSTNTNTGTSGTTSAPSTAPSTAGKPPVGMNTSNSSIPGQGPVEAGGSTYAAAVGFSVLFGAVSLLLNL